MSVEKQVCPLLPLLECWRAAVLYGSESWILNAKVDGMRRKVRPKRILTEGVKLLVKQKGSICH